MAALIAVPVFELSLLFGFKGLTWLLGHLFLTHHENERKTFITALLWGVLAGLALVASYFVPSP